MAAPSAAPATDRPSSDDAADGGASAEAQGGGSTGSSGTSATSATTATPDASGSTGTSGAPHAPDATAVADASGSTGTSGAPHAADAPDAPDAPDASGTSDATGTSGGSETSGGAAATEVSGGSAVTEESGSSVASAVADASGSTTDAVSGPRTQSSIDDVPTRTVTFESPSADGGTATAEPSSGAAASAGTAPADAGDRPVDTTTYDTVRDADDNVVSSTATTYDAEGNPVRVVERTFDADGNVTSSTTTVNVYDDSGLVTSDTSAIVDGVRVSATQEGYSRSGEVIERTVVTYDADGDPDTRVERTFDEGGAPLTTSTTVYDDDGEPISQTRQIEDGRTVTSYDEGEHVRTTRAEDGTVTRETLVVDENGSPVSRRVEETDANGEIQRSEENYYGDDGNVVESSEFTYTDGRATSQRTVSVDDDGTSVTQRTLDDEQNPSSEVRTSYDSEGNVTSTTYVDYDDDGEVVSEGDAPSNAHLYDQLDLPDLDLATVTGTQDASAVMAALRGDAPPVSADDLRDGLETTFGSSATSGSGTVDSSGGSVAADSVTTISYGDGEVSWEQVVTDPDGSIRFIRGYHDGSIEVERPSKWLEDGLGTDLEGLPTDMAESIRSAFTVVERISPDGTRTVREPLVEDLDTDEFAQMMWGSFDPLGSFGSPPDLSFLTTVNEITYGADGEIERTVSIQHDLEGDVVYREESVIDGRTTTTTATQYENGAVVDEATTQTTEPEPVSGSTIEDFSDPDLPDPAGVGGTAVVSDSLSSVAGFGSKTPEISTMLGETTVTNDDGTTIVTRRAVADGDVAWEQTVTEADGSVRVIRGYDDGSIEIETASDIAELFAPDGLGGALGLPESAADHFRVVERIAPDGSRTVREPTLDLSGFGTSEDFFAGSFDLSGLTIDPTTLFVIHEVEYAADGSVTTTKAIHYDEHLEEAYVEETVHHDDGTTTTTTTQSADADAGEAEATDDTDPVDADPSVDATDPAAAEEASADLDQTDGDQAGIRDPLSAAEGVDDQLAPNLGLWDEEQGAAVSGDVDDQLAPNLGLWDPGTEGEVAAPGPTRATNWGAPEPTDASTDFASSFDAAAAGDDFLTVEGSVGESVDDSGDDDLKFHDLDATSGDQFLKIGDIEGERVDVETTDMLDDGFVKRIEFAEDVDESSDQPGQPTYGEDLSVDAADLYPQTDVFSSSGVRVHDPSHTDGSELPDPFAAGSGGDAGVVDAPVVGATDATSLKYPIEHGSYQPTGEFGDVPEQLAQAVEGDPLALPGDHFDPVDAAALPGDHFDPVDAAALPGDHFDPVDAAALAEPQSTGSDPSVASALVDGGTAQIGSAGGAYPPQVPIDQHALGDVEALPVAPEPVVDVAPVVPDLSVSTDFDLSVDEATFHEPVVEAPQISESFDEPALDADIDAALGDDLGDGLPGG